MIDITPLFQTPLSENSKKKLAQNVFVCPYKNIELSPKNVCDKLIVLPLNEEIIVLRREVEQLQDSWSRLSIQQRPARTVKCFICSRIGHCQNECKLNVPRYSRLIYHGHL